jgi:hypothetical protein
MLLKLKTKPDSDWMIIGDIRRVVYNTVTGEIKQEASDLIIGANTDNENVWRIIYIFYADGSQMQIATQQNAYLLNDNGKTIEIIY